MIINIDAFKKAENVINQEQDKLNGEAAIRYIQATNPIVIIDEPQSVDNTPKAQEAIASLNPLCVLRYSATHRSKQNLVYRLTPVDAYQLGLVKQISVISNSVINDSNKPYIALKSVSGNNGFSAKIEMDIENATGKVERKIITVKPDDDLFIKSGHRKLYENYVVSGIDCTSGYECIEFANSETVELGQSIGSVDPDTIKRAMIYHTIRTHLDKELRYHAKGIKVLSLFFIDEVKKYRTEDGGKGIYAEMFEECYNELINKPKYADLKNQFNPDVAKAHNGYFSQDKKGKYKDTRGDTQADDDTYNTIMKDKEWLLSFECPLRFIFSHSALKEGWDNPNVFQVCTLIDQKSVFTCRQKIGRGLRLCVNQNGERIEDKDINVLHVVANESFSQFATKLQTEIENETGIRFGIVELSMLIGMTYDEEKEVERSISTEEAETIVSTLQTSGIIDENGSLTADFAPEKVENIQFENVPEPVKQEVYQALKTEQPLRVETLTNKTYTQTIVEKKAVDYEEAAEILETLKKENIITKEGKVKDTMKAQLAAGTLDLSARYSQAKQRAILQVMNKADNRPVNCHEYILSYSKTLKPKGSMSIPKSNDEISSEYVLKDERGNYRELELRNTHRDFGKFNRPNLFYPIYVNDKKQVSLTKSLEYHIEVYPIWGDGFEGCWTWGKQKVSDNINLLTAKKNGNYWKIYRKAYAFIGMGFKICFPYVKKSGAAIC